MKLYAISDLHLPGGQDKPMDIFGPNWENHPALIRTNWCACVQPEDYVLVPGDISWAMQLDEAAADLEYLGTLPGHKIIVRGNHDYWWHSIGHVRQALPASIQAIQNDCLLLPGDVVVCGSRGWDLPESGGTTAPGGPAAQAAQDRKIYERELLRLEMSLRIAQKTGAAHIIAMLHFPPSTPEYGRTGFTALLTEYGVEKCVYGHLHGNAERWALRGTYDGVFYQLVAADALHFTPYFLCNLAEGPAQ